ncbi:Re/Si-specific NAD(P)(+) transhydrogenase subunit alpha [Algivirga pacifica]|uniref:proton-translocating NAD(P)(+) transhydrogenase n=1 Tax=Algivirga pacifica TaxID=1162670 RepID=A0ABP9D347_9BACT
MVIGILNETSDKRVAVVPALVQKLVKEGHSVYFEKGAGLTASVTDTAYEEAGAISKERNSILEESDFIPTIHPISKDEATQLKANATLLTLLQPFQTDEFYKGLSVKEITAFSFDMIPRSTIAQSMDVLSSMASIAGYKSVLTAADLLPRYIPMLSTAAGTIPPAKVLILGAGVAGLQAIATAKRLGGQVEAFDTRPAAKEEVQSLGAKFVEVEGAADASNAGGYAVEQTEEYKQKQKALIEEKVQKADVIITTAQLRGKPAPTLITEEMVKSMKEGSVIIDLASSTGGNCALTEDEKTVVKHGVNILGSSQLAAEVPEHASQLFSRNIENFLKILLVEGQLTLDFSNDILRSSCVIYNGQSVYGETDSLIKKNTEAEKEEAIEA